MRGNAASGGGVPGGGRVNARGGFRVEHQQALALAVDELEAVDDVLDVFFFLDLLGDEPLQEDFRRVVALVFREGDELVDAARDFRFVRGGGFEHAERAVP